MKPHPQEMVDHVRELRSLGARTAEIVTACGVSRSFVHTVTRDIPAPKPRRCLSDATIAQVREMYFVSVPLRTIRIVTGVKQVHDYVQDLPGRQDVPRAELRRAYVQGIAVNRIAKRFRVARSTVRAHCDDLREKREAVLTKRRAKKLETATARIRDLYSKGVSWTALRAMGFRGGFIADAVAGMTARPLGRVPAPAQ